MPPRPLSRLLSSTFLLTLSLALTACRSSTSAQPDPIVGVWTVSIPAAPFPMHLFVFHSDGTVEQSNPDAGDPASSDSNLMGAWVRDHDAYRAKMVEFHADRATHKLTGRTEISFQFQVHSNTLTGTATATPYDPTKHPTATPIHATLQGARVTP